jgi:uncharacterized protein YbjT (DUF2867 family)
MTKVLITGASGFVGSEILRQLIAITPTSAPYLAIRMRVASRPASCSRAGRV